MKYGFLGYPHLEAPGDVLHYFSAGLNKRKDLLELGCGRGCLVRAMRLSGWTGHYCGVDISKQAISDARKFEDQRSSWVICDLESFRSPFLWDAIVMIESIYYLNLDNLPITLSRIVEMLAEDGKLLVRIHDSEKHRDYVKAIHHLYPGTKSITSSLFCIFNSSQFTNR
jgi:cyclopropane fatty-acyl-phospholipid synthase-like methyltransferase